MRGTKLFNRQGQEVLAEAGTFRIQDLQTYTLQVEADGGAPSLPPHVRPIAAGGGRIAIVCFENYVGRAEVGGHRFEVNHSKLTPDQFDTLLDEVVERTDELAFGFESPTGFSAQDSGSVAGGSIPYHALAYLRHVMTRLSGGEGLMGQFLELARSPHRRVKAETAWVRVGQAAAVSPGALLAVAGHPEMLARIAGDHPLAATSLGRALRRRQGSRADGLYPTDVLDTRRLETFDTHENRLVKAFLREALDAVGRFSSLKLRNPSLRADLATMRGELEWMASYDFLHEVGELTVVPSSSTVLQRRSGYKEVFRHWLALRAATALSDDPLWLRLLDAKDCATLYEVWCFFQVKALMDQHFEEAPTVAIAVDDVEATVPWSARVVYEQGRVALTYNRTYRGMHAAIAGASRFDTSYSVTLRPDVVVHVRRGDGRSEALVLDAKFKFDGQRLAIVPGVGPASAGAEDLSGDDDDEPVRRAVKADIHKMHAYRDALQDVVGAFVVFPGTAGATVFFPAGVGTRRFDGVGAISLAPGGTPSALTELLIEFVRIPPQP